MPTVDRPYRLTDGVMAFSRQDRSPTETAHDAPDVVLVHHPAAALEEGVRRVEGATRLVEIAVRTERQPDEIWEVLPKDLQVQGEASLYPEGDAGGDRPHPPREPGSERGDIVGVDLQRIRPRPIAHAIPSHEFGDTELIVGERPLAPGHEFAEAFLHRAHERAREDLPQRLPRLGLERVRLRA